MKKNDVMGYVVYALMLAIAVVVGFAIIRPIFSETNYVAVVPLNNGILFVLIAIVTGVLVSAFLLELGHFIGAKLGHYQIASWDCLGVCIKKGAKGKTKVSFASFDGITGETKVIPTDVKKSNPRHMIYVPLFFFFLEVVACVIVMVYSQTKAASDITNISWIWGYVFSITVLAVSGMIFLYDIFPAPLDSKNDGYLITILTNETNVEAYNQMLLAEDKIAHGFPAGTTPVYESVTDFTARVNDITLYEDLKKGDFAGALKILEYTIACKKTVSANIYHNAIAQKTAILLFTEPLDKVKQFYIDLPLEDKKYIAGLNTGACVRAYILISGLVEDSLSETETAMDKADSAIKGSGSDKKPIEEKLVVDSVKKVLARHPDWDLSSYGFGAKDEEKKKETPVDASLEKKVDPKQTEKDDKKDK
jgi:hypothetical protein